VLTKLVLYILSHTSVYFALVILEKESHELFSRLALDNSSPDLSLPSSKITGVSHRSLTCAFKILYSHRTGSKKLCAIL
jgi:hypothetical protein